MTRDAFESCFRIYTVAIHYNKVNRKAIYTTERGGIYSISYANQTLSTGTVILPVNNNNHD